MPTSIDRALRPPSRSNLPLVALLLGVLSGPATIGCTLLFAEEFPPDYELKLLRLLDLSALTIWIGGSLVLSIVSLIRYGQAKRARLFSLIGIAASIIWLIAFYAVVVYVRDHMITAL
jgi:hypothetical protein